MQIIIGAIKKQQQWIVCPAFDSKSNFASKNDHLSFFIDFMKTNHIFHH